VSIVSETYTLATGATIPKLGLGTWMIDDDQVADAVRAAIEIGYRNVDTAQAYGNERGVGEGVRNSGVARSELFVSTKLAAEIKDHNQAAAAINKSLAKLDVDYIDLMLIHAPQPWDDFRGGDYSEGNLAAWKALEAAHQAGTVRAIGVSNFLQTDLDNILDNASVTPHVNQILVHAGNTPSELIDYCQARSILIEAYSPIAHGEILDNNTVKSIADRYGVSVPQLCIRYSIQLGTVALPKTANPQHMRSNADADFMISDEDMHSLRDLHERDYGNSSALPVYSGK
jgi:diketogulonate reductase-like aldo/keto reductase